jgi:hypothetical protein
VRLPTCRKTGSVAAGPMEGEHNTRRRGHLSVGYGAHHGPQSRRSGRGALRARVPRAGERPAAVTTGLSCTMRCDTGRSRTVRFSVSKYDPEQYVILSCCTSATSSAIEAISRRTRRTSPFTCAVLSDAGGVTLPSSRDDPGRVSIATGGSREADGTHNAGPSTRRSREVPHTRNTFRLCNRPAPDGAGKEIPRQTASGRCAPRIPADATDARRPPLSWGAARRCGVRRE